MSLFQSHNIFFCSVLFLALSNLLPRAGLHGRFDNKKGIKRILKLGVNTRIDEIALQTEIEKGLVKIRYSVNNTKDNETIEHSAEQDKIRNRESKVINMAMTKATELKFNRRLHPPDAAEKKLEANLQQTKTMLQEVTNKYIKQKCDKNGDLKDSNLDNDLKEGLRSLKQKVKTGEGIVMPTDKTDGLSFETVKGYKIAAEEHQRRQTYF